MSWLPWGPLLSFQEYVLSIPIDPMLLDFYKIGLVVGLLVVTTLSLFPGKPWGIQYGNDQDAPVAASVPCDTTQATTGERLAHSSGDAVPPEEKELLRDASSIFSTRQLSNIQQRFGLSHDEMRRIVQDSQRQKHKLVDDNERQWTPHQQLNAVVYLIIFGVLALVVHRDYNHGFQEN